MECSSIKNNILGFWKISEPYGFLSNWFKSNFTYKGITFTSAEQALMYSKAIIFHDSEIADQILKVNDPKTIKALGRKVKNFDSKIWNEVKAQTMEDILWEKFSQDEYLKQQLLSTAPLTLVEASPVDRIWGIGLSIQGAFYDPAQWRGQNVLGKSLMAVRDRLK